MSPSSLSFEAGRDDDDVGGERLPGGEADACRVEALDGVGDDRGAAGADRREQVAVGDQADALVPGLVARREVHRRVGRGAELLGRHRDDALP